MLLKKASEDPELLKQMQAKGTGVKWVGPADYAKWFEKTYQDHEKVAVKIGMFKKQ
jgi:tripartite-type tricarboxylate transporter receptor subunit TctC